MRLTFWFPFFAVICKRRPEMTKFSVFTKTWPRDSKFFFLFLNFNTVHSKSDPGQFASIFKVKQVGIIPKELQKPEVSFFKWRFRWRRRRRRRCVSSLLFCRGRQRNVPKCKMHVQSDWFCSLKPIVLWRSRSWARCGDGLALKGRRGV